MATKRVFLGSLFDFVKPNEVVQELNKGFPDSDVAPFIIYEKSKKLFSYEEKDSHGTALKKLVPVIDQLSSYVDQNRESASNPIASPRLKPIEGTSLYHGHQVWTSPQEDHNSLFEYDSSSEDESEEASIAGPVRAYWQPNDADLTILPEDIATAIADMTGCFLFPEPTHRRIKIVGGDVKDAVLKLQNLEPLLKYVVKHKEGGTVRLNAHIMVLRTQGTQGAVKFAQLREHHPGVDRVILPSRHRKLISQVLVAEARYRENDAVTFKKPLNLDLEGVEPSSERDFSRLFGAEHMPVIGVAGNAEPSVTQSYMATKSNFPEEELASARFLGSNQAARVAQWSKAVEPGFNPEIYHGIGQNEEPQGTRKRVVEDSDTESDVEEGVTVVQKALTTHESFDLQSTNHPPPLTAITNRQHISSGFSRIQQPLADVQSKVIEQTFRVDQKARSTDRLHTQRTSVEHKAPSCAHRNMFDLLEDDSDQLDPIDEEADQASELEDHQINKFSNNPRANEAVISDTNHLRSDSNGHLKPDNYNADGQRRMLLNSCHTPPQNVTSSRNVHERNSATPHSFSHQSDAVQEHLGTLEERNMNLLKATEISSTERNHDNHTNHIANPLTALQVLSGNADIPLNTGEDLLIDLSDKPHVSGPTVVPPGYHYRSALNDWERDMNLMNSVVQNRMILPILPERSSSRAGKTLSETNSGMSEGAYVAHNTVRKRDIDVIRRQKLAEYQRKAGMKVNDNDAVEEGDWNNITLPQKQHASTKPPSRNRPAMNQKISNSARKNDSRLYGRSPVVKETKKEKEIRITKALAEAYGDPLPTSSANQAPMRNDDAHALPLSRKKPAKRMQQPIQSDVGLEQERIIKEQTKLLRAELQPLFEACRAFSGKVEFKIHLGQALILRNRSLKENKLFATNDWTMLFREEHAPQIESLFTNIFTDNGVEIDGLLEMKGFNRKSKLWSTVPQKSTVIEFCCQDTSGQNFNILVLPDGSHKLLKGRQVIGKIALHQPDHIWDACSIVEGENVWHTAPATVIDGVQQLMDSLFVPSKLKAVVFFRQPSNSAFVVRDVNVKRYSTHACLDEDHDDCELHLTEVKNLVHCSHPTDQRLYRSTELGYKRMVKSGRLHYEIAISSKSVNNAFNQFNTTLKLGELTPNDLTGKNLADFAVLQKLIRVSNYVIEKIDWIGAENYGTCRQTMEEVQYQQSRIQQSMPPQIAAQLHQGKLLPSIIGQKLLTTRGDVPISGQSSLLGPSTTTVSAFNELPPIPGVRAGTTAPLFRQGGRHFRLGIGGARVPVPGVDDLVLPSDSASQAGNGFAGRLPSHNRDTSTKPDEKPASFW